MKINTTSWHYKVMSLYQYAKYLNAPLNFYYDVNNYKVMAVDETLNYEEFKDFSLKTGKYLPMDFCSYWRNVLLWPAIPIILWLIAISLMIFTMSFIGFSGFMFLGLLGLCLAIFIGIAMLIAFGTAVVEHGLAKNKGFFHHLKQSVEDSSFCVTLEYKND